MLNQASLGLLANQLDKDYNQPHTRRSWEDILVRTSFFNACMCEFRQQEQGSRRIPPDGQLGIYPLGFTQKAWYAYVRAGWLGLPSAEAFESLDSDLLKAVATLPKH